MSYAIHLATFQSQPAAVVHAYVKQEDIAEFLGGAFEEVVTALGQQGLSPAGPPFGRCVPSDGGFQVEAGYPVDRSVKAAGRVTPDELPGGTVAPHGPHGCVRRDRCRLRGRHGLDGRQRVRRLG